VLAKLASWCYRRRRLVLAAWLVLLVGISAISSSVGDAYATTFSLGDSDAGKAQDLLRAAGSTDANVTGTLVVKADAGLSDPAIAARVGALIDEMSRVPHVASLPNPLDDPTGQLVSSDGRIAYTTIGFDSRYSQLPEQTSAPINALRERYDTDGLQVELGGAVFANRKPPGGTEAIGLVAAVFILLLAFGSVLAMGLPIMTALFGLGIGFGFVGLLSNVFEMPEFTTQLAAMIGIGVGIDYALFIVTRYRQGLRDGLEPHASVVTAIATAGSAVLFAGCTVIISLCGMFFMGIAFVRGLAIGASVVVLVTMIASVTLLPAVLGFTGHAIDRLRLPGTGKEKANEETIAYRWSHLLQRHPWPAAVLGVIILVALALPVFDIRLGSSDDSNKPTTDTTRRSYDLLSEGFGPGFNGPLLIAAKLPADAPSTFYFDLATKVARTPGVQSVSPSPDIITLIESGQIPEGTGPQLPKDLAVLRVFPTTSPQDQATNDLLHRLRDDVLPAATAGTTIEAHVGGLTAIFDDIASQLQARLPIFIGAVLALSFLLLMVVFRSIVVPMKAVVLNLLSIGAAYGVVVTIFQHGHFASLIGVGKGGPIESFVPMMMFAILFGLSMDYEVFLLSRIKEEYDRTGDNKNAVADGLAHTARVITAAAAIMVTVFGSFVFGDNRVVKEFGLGLAVAILIDATIVRMVLVPASMELLGDANWWFPKWLSWLPRVHIDGADVQAITDQAAADAPRDDAPGDDASGDAPGDASGDDRESLVVS